MWSTCIQHSTSRRQKTVKRARRVVPMDGSYADHATNYFQHCQFVGVEPVMEFVAALSAAGPGAKCVLTSSSPPLADKDVGCIAEALRDSGVVELHLAGNDITMSGAEDIAAALRINPNMLRLSVGDNSISDEGALSFAAALKDNVALVWLDLQGNAIGNRGVAGLAEVLTTNAVLQQLLLQRNDVQCQGIASLFEALKLNSALRSLNLSINRIADVGAAAVGQALQLNRTLVEVDLAGNQVGPEGGVAIAAGLAANSALRVLNLNDNAVGDAGAIAFATHALGSPSSGLEGLHLQNNQIAVQGCVALADSLMSNTKVMTLDVHGNPGSLERAGSLAFAEMIRSNQTLIILNFDLQSTNEAGGTAIAEAMRINTTITDLNCGAQGAAWPMDAAMRAEVDNTLRINKFLRGVDSDGADGGLSATATRFPPAAPAVAASAVATPAKESATPAAASPPAFPTPAPTSALAAPAPAPALMIPSQSAAAAAASGGGGGGADSPGSMLELLRQKLDAFQVGEAAVAPAPAHSAPAPALVPASVPAPLLAPTLAAAATGSALAAGAAAEANESVLTPSPTTTGMMVSAEELQQLHERVRLMHVSHKSNSLLNTEDALVSWWSVLISGRYDRVAESLEPCSAAPGVGASVRGRTRSAQGRRAGEELRAGGAHRAADATARWPGVKERRHAERRGQPQRRQRGCERGESCGADHERRAATWSDQ